MKWFNIPLSMDVVHAICSVMNPSARARTDLHYSLGRRYHLYIREDCKYFLDRAATCPVMCSRISLDELNILLLDKALKD